MHHTAKSIQAQCVQKGYATNPKYKFEATVAWVEDINGKRYTAHLTPSQADLVKQIRMVEARIRADRHVTKVTESKPVSGLIKHAGLHIGQHLTHKPFASLKAGI